MRGAAVKMLLPSEPGSCRLLTPARSAAAPEAFITAPRGTSEARLKRPSSRLPAGLGPGAAALELS